MRTEERAKERNKNFQSPPQEDQLKQRLEALMIERRKIRRLESFTKKREKDTADKRGIRIDEAGGITRLEVKLTKNQDNAMAHHQKISLYNFLIKDEEYALVIYNTEIETKQEIIIKTPEILDNFSCITQLPRGKLFCYGRGYPVSGITLIIDESGEVEVLPSGPPREFSSAIYFNNSVYCFGGRNNNGELTQSSRFDLDRNKWVKLAPLPIADIPCNSIIFNGNIMISWVCYRNIVRYSIGSNFFTTIPYQFAYDKRKTLINGERLYLIESGKNGWIYESEIGSDTAWRPIAKSTIKFRPFQISFSYYKGGVYIGCNNYDCRRIDYFRFNFSNKCLIRLPN